MNDTLSLLAIGKNLKRNMLFSPEFVDIHNVSYNISNSRSSYLKIVVIYYNVSTNLTK